MIDIFIISLLIALFSGASIAFLLTPQEGFHVGKIVFIGSILVGWVIQISDSPKEPEAIVCPHCKEKNHVKD